MLPVPAVIFHKITSQLNFLTAPLSQNHILVMITGQILAGPPLPRVVVVSLFHTFESSIAYPASGPLQGCILTEVHRPRYYLSARACRRGIWSSLPSE